MSNPFSNEMMEPDVSPMNSRYYLPKALIMKLLLLAGNLYFRMGQLTDMSILPLSRFCLFFINKSITIFIDTSTSECHHQQSSY